MTNPPGIFRRLPPRPSPVLGPRFQVTPGQDRPGDAPPPRPGTGCAGPPARRRARTASACRASRPRRTGDYGLFAHGRLACRRRVRLHEHGRRAGLGNWASAARDRLSAGQALMAVTAGPDAPRELAIGGMSCAACAARIEKRQPRRAPRGIARSAVGQRGGTSPPSRRTPATSLTDQRGLPAVPGEVAEGDVAGYHYRAANGRSSGFSMRASRSSTRASGRKMAGAIVTSCCAPVTRICELSA